MTITGPIIRAGRMSEFVNCLLKAVIFLARPHAKQRLHIGHWLYILGARQFFQSGRFPEDARDGTVLANR